MRARSVRGVLRKAALFLAVVLAVDAAAAGPALAMGTYGREYTLAGPEGLDDYVVEGHIYVEWDYAASYPNHLRTRVEARKGLLFGTQAKRCAVKMSGQLMDSAGTVWNIPDVAYACTETFNGQRSQGAYVGGTNLNTDTNAVAIRPFVCVYFYYDNAPTWSRCAGDGAWLPSNKTNTPPSLSRQKSRIVA